MTSIEKILLKSIPRHLALYQIISKALKVSNAYARCVYEKYGGFVLIDNQLVMHETKTCICCNEELVLPRHSDVDVPVSERLTKTSMHITPSDMISTRALCGRHMLCQRHMNDSACPLCMEWSEDESTEKIQDVDYYTSDMHIDLQCIRTVYPHKQIAMNDCGYLRGKRIVVLHGTLSEKCQRQNDVVSI